MNYRKTPPKVWHKKDREMYDDVWRLSWGDDGKLYEIWANGRTCYKPDEIILLWSTGLLDKDGKEIYAGDIVKMNPVDDHWNDVVVFKKGHFELQSFKNMVTDCSLQDWCRGSKNPCIVVGNTFENPELLTQDKK